MAVFKFTRIYSNVDGRRKLFALPNEGVDLDGSNTNKTGMIVGGAAGLAGAAVWNRKHLLSGEGANLVKSAAEANKSLNAAQTAFKNSGGAFSAGKNLVSAKANAMTAKNNLQAFNKANKPGMMNRFGKGAALLGAGMLVGNMISGGNKNKDN